jgi:hypothetical protein
MYHALLQTGTFFKVQGRATRVLAIVPQYYNHFKIHLEKH